MAQRTIARMYDNYSDAQVAVRELEEAGIPNSDISIVANADAHGRSNAGSSTTGSGEHTGTGGGTGAVLGTVLGGGAGLLAGIGALAIPGVGPVVAAGWLVATLTGAGVGAAALGLIGSLTGAGLSRDEAHVYAEGVKRGGSLVTVRSDEANAARVEQILAQRGAVDWQKRRTAYGDGWVGFDETASGAAADTRPAAVQGSSPIDDPNRRL
jgi:hypothetical protein